MAATYAKYCVHVVSNGAVSTRGVGEVSAQNEPAAPLVSSGDDLEQ